MVNAEVGPSPTLNSCGGKTEGCLPKGRGVSFHSHYVLLHPTTATLPLPTVPQPASQACCVVIRKKAAERIGTRNSVTMTSGVGSARPPRLWGQGAMLPPWALVLHPTHGEKVTRPGATVITNVQQ